MKRLLCTTATVAAAVALSGCAGPKLVSSISKTRNDQTRVVWYQNKSIPLIRYTTEQGLIDCNRTPAGQFTECKPVKIVFKDKEE